MRILASTVLVTGANRGLGSRIVLEVLNAGAAKVYATARNISTIAPEVADDARVSVLRLDIEDDRSIAAAAEVASDVTILINNAGALGFGDVLHGDLSLFERDMSTNYFGTLRVSRAFTPVLANNAPAAIANVLTLISLAPIGAMAGYCASKAAAHSMTQALRASVRPLGIEVIGAYPGGIDTDMLAGVDGVKADPADVAARLVSGIEAGTAVVWPDDVSSGAGSVYLADPLQLEQMLAG